MTSTPLYIANSLGLTPEVSKPPKLLGAKPRILVNLNSHDTIRCAVIIVDDVQGVGRSLGWAYRTLINAVHTIAVKVDRLDPSNCPKDSCALAGMDRGWIDATNVTYAV